MKKSFFYVIKNIFNNFMIAKEILKYPIAFQTRSSLEATHSWPIISLRSLKSLNTASELNDFESNDKKSNENVL